MKVDWVNGRFGAQISPHDAGFLSGHGVYESIGVFRGNIPLWDRHMRRLEQGATKLGIPCRIPADLPSHSLALLARNPEDDVLRVILTAGVDGRPTWSMTTESREPKNTQLLHIHTVGDRREDPLATMRSTSCAFHVLTRRIAWAAGFDDALLVDGDGRVLETTTGNVFFWLNSGLCTPRLDGSIRPGIARAALLAELEYLGVQVSQTDHSITELANHNGLFTTDAVHGPRAAATSAGESAALAPVIVEAWLRAIRENRARVRRPGPRPREDGLGSQS